MRTYAETAVKELKESGEWRGYEERINYQCEYEPLKSPTRALILIILRGESPESILITLELKSGKRRNHIEEIKKQIKSYFASDARRKGSPPVIFSIKEYKVKLIPKN